MITRNIIKILPLALREKVENNYKLREILGNINWLTLESIFNKVIALFVIIIVARYLGPEQFGLMNYALAFVTLFSIFASLGLDDIVVRELVSQPDKKEQYLGSTLLLKFLGSLLLLFVSTVSINFIEPGNNLLHLFVFIYAFAYIFKSFDVIDLWFRSQVKSQYSVYARSISFVIVSSLKIIFVFTQAPLIAFILMTALDFFLTSVFLIYLYFKNTQISFRKWKVKMAIIKSLFKDSWPLILSGLTVLISLRIDQVMIGSMLGEMELGIYSAAVKISEAWYAVPIIITTSVFPAIIHAKKLNKDLYLKRIQILYDGFFWFTIFVASLVAFISPFVINLLYGDLYSPAANILSVHIWAGIFVFWGIVNGKYLITENLTRMVLYITSLGAILNVIFNLMLISSYGPLGAAFATLLSQMISCTFVMLFFKDTRILFKMQLRTFNIFRIFRYFSL